MNLLPRSIYQGKSLIRQGKIDIDHIDGNKQNNHIDNFKGI